MNAEISDEQAEMYGDVCDAVFRTLYPEWDVPDGMRHTSDEARRVATAVFDALGLWGLDDSPQNVQR